MLDFESDFGRVTDGLTTATLVRPGGSSTTILRSAMRRALTAREASASRGRYAAEDAVWHLAASELTMEPLPGDRLVDASGRRWTILQVGRRAWGHRRRCVARDVVASYGLNEFVDIERASVAKAADGTETLRWQVRRTGLAARIQPVEAEVRTERHRRTSASHFRILLEEAVDLSADDRVRGPDGRRYAILRWRKAESLGLPFEIDAARWE